jgi:Domain of unknown function (DUF4157)
MRTFAQKQNQPQKQVSSSFARSNRAILGPNHHADPLLHLQRTIGNQTVQRMLQTHAEELEVGSPSTAASHFAPDFGRIPIHPPAAGTIQAKLTVNTSGDIYEQEADVVAEQVMRMATPLAPNVQRQTDAEKLLQRKTTGNAQVQTAPPIVHEVLRSPGQPLDASTRTFMEPRFGHDFSRVRVHADSEAASSAQAIGARAYTAGQHIVFGPERYDMATGDGRRLLAHELTHILQSPDHGSANDLVKRDEDKGSGHEKRKETAKKAPKCQIAKAQIRPVFFRNDPGKDDPNPTGKSLAPRLQEANRIWGKCGVEFQAEKPKMVEDSQSKIAGNKHEELNAVERAYGKKGTGPQVFFLDNDLSFVGGGRTGPNIGASVATGDDARIMLSDHGSNDRLLAHELGHAMGIAFHPDVAKFLPKNSIMQPSGVSKTNPDLVTDTMCRLLAWPATTDEKCWHVDPDDKATFDKPEQTEKKK